MNTIGSRIAQRRNELGLSQKELATAAGLKSSGAIGNYESMQRGAPRNLLKLAKALQVQAEWLETGKGLKELQKERTTASGLEPIDLELLMQFHKITHDSTKYKIIGYVEAIAEKQKNMSDHRLHANTKKAALNKG
ncbi:helix-turn-helix domain-containing protein [Polynucleobacter sp. 86C-FISCH]|uniref:helix-turn-helix domain-containing protein n=1 Tax=Polynucleobacter sp. 86C-FISCH TaxID=2689101 RepID=UPI001C20C75B